MVALLLLGLRLVRLPLGGQLHRLLVAGRRDRLLVLLAQLGDLVREPLARLRVLLGQPPLQRLDLALVRRLDARQLRLPRPLGRGHRLAVLVGELGRLGPVRLLQLGAAASPSRRAAGRPPSARAASSCAARFLIASTSSCALRSSTCASSSRALSPFSRSPDFSRSCPSSATLSLAATRFRSNPMVLSSRSRRARSSSRILSLWSRIWRSLASSASRRSRMSFSFLLMISRRPRNSRSLEKVADCVNRSRASSISLRSVCRSFSSEWIRASSSALRASASRAAAVVDRPARAEALGDDPPARLGRDVLEGDLVGRRRHVVLGASAACCGERRGEQRVGHDRLRPQRLAGPVDVGIEVVAVESPRGTALRRRLARSGGFSQARFGGRSSSDQRFRRSTMSSLGERRLRRAGLQRRERGLRLRIELLPLERGGGHAVLRQDLLLRGVSARWRSRRRCRSCRDRRPASRPRSSFSSAAALLTMSTSSSSAITMSESASSSWTSSSSAAAARVQLQEPADLDQQVLAVERLQHVLVGVRLQLLVLLERRLRLLRRNQHQRDLAQARAAPQLVADRVADLLRLDGEDDDRGLVGAPPLHRVVAARDVLDLEAVRA